MAESNTGYKLCRYGDLVINTMWAWMGAMGVARQLGLVSPSYGVYRPANESSHLPTYLDHLLRTQPYVTEYLCRSTGIRSSRLRLYPDKFLDIHILQPPRNEQEAMIKYIDYHDHLVRRYIRNRRRLIELVAEQRDSATQEAMRSPNTSQLRFGVVADQIERSIQRQEDETFVPIGLFNRGRGIFHKQPTPGKHLGDSTFFFVEDGDLVFSGQFAWEGAVALAGHMDTGRIASHRYPIFRGKTGLVDAAYLFAYFRTREGDTLLNHHSRGAAGRNRPLNVRTLTKEKIPIPPLEIQQQISALVTLETVLRQRIANEISLINEYRTRLIADVVTGKVDVRHLALSVDTPDEQEVELDDVDELIDEEIIGELDDEAEQEVAYADD